MTQNILRIDASARHQGSVTRELNDRVIARLDAAGVTKVVQRDLTDTLPFIDEAWIGANFTQPDDRSDAQRKALELSDALIEELKEADTLVIGMPVYNFSVPAALKVWIDLIARVGVTFRYTETGPVGLLTGKRAIITVASGGTQVGSDIDFATGYVRFVLGFVGITDVQFVSADNLAVDPEGTITAAHDAVEKLELAA